MLASYEEGGTDSRENRDEDVKKNKRTNIEDRVKSVDIRNDLGVSRIQEKVRETRLRWYGHIQRMEENNELRSVGDMRVPGKRPRERPRGR